MCINLDIPPSALANKKIHFQFYILEISLSMTRRSPKQIHSYIIVPVEIKSLFKVYKMNIAFLSFQVYVLTEIPQFIYKVIQFSSKFYTMYIKKLSVNPFPLITICYLVHTLIDQEWLETLEKLELGFYMSAVSISKQYTNSYKMISSSSVFTVSGSRQVTTPTLWLWLLPTWKVAFGKS